MSKIKPYYIHGSIKDVYYRGQNLKELLEHPGVQKNLLRDGARLYQCLTHGLYGTLPRGARACWHWWHPVDGPSEDCILKMAPVE